MTPAVQRPSQFVTAFAVLLLTMSGCVNIDRDYPREPTTTFPPVPDTRLARDIEPLLTDRPPDQSGFYILSDGIDALTVRLLLAARAETSIDLQYYLVKNDLTGRAARNWPGRPIH